MLGRKQKTVHTIISSLMLCISGMEVFPNCISLKYTGGFFLPGLLMQLAKQVALILRKLKNNILDAERWNHIKFLPLSVSLCLQQSGIG